MYGPLGPVNKLAKGISQPNTSRAKLIYLPSPINAISMSAMLAFAIAPLTNYYAESAVEPTS